MAISTRISQALHALPKTELHLHIEGTLEPDSPYGWPTVTA